MTPWRAFTEGAGRVRRTPALVVGLWLMTFLLAWPLALLLRGMLADHLGASLAAETAARGVNFDWWNEFLAQAGGIGQTFVPAILGFAAVLQNVSSIADAEGLPAAVGSVVATHLVLSVFLTGGVLDRLARDRRVGTYGFFAACGTYFFRLVRLALVAALLYWLIFTSLHSWLFDSVFVSLTREITVERTAIAYRFLLYLAFATVVAAVNVIVDYAKVRMVVEDRRSALGALSSSVRFVARNGGAVFSLYAITVVIFLAVLATYALVAPGASGGVTAWLAFWVGQLYITLRVAVRLLFAASEVALFQGRLAHARYTAAAVPAWPDSPAAEAIIPR
jgi:hypothetical protein